jgi:capsule biosynthesis phosphatase
MQKIIIIPLGGLGNRFKIAGYDLPKPLINVLGKPIIYWLLENLDLSDIEYVYIPYNKELKKYRFEDLLQKDFHNIKFKFYCLENHTRGAAETIKIALDNLDLKDNKDNKDNKHVMCIDNDNFFTENITKYWNGENLVYTFKDNHEQPIYSYVSINNNNNLILDIKEKCKISNNACCGIYAFNSALQLLDACNYIINNNIREKDEFYTSVVIKHLLTQNNDFFNKQINKNNYFCLGTPLQVKIFCNNYNKNLIKPKKYCFDLDNTLVTFPKIKNDYTSVEPIPQNIEMVRMLKNLGHIIIIYTARRMKTHSGNVGKIMADIGKITFDTLDKFNIPYDEIFFGKPNADYYIDDLAISSYANLEKALGFYNNDIESRDFNIIESSNFEIIKKSSNDSKLEGEIYFYKEIQKIEKNQEIKDLFPIFINHDVNNKWYQIEKINGISICKLFLSGELSIDLLKKIIDSIIFIQDINPNYDPNYNSSLNIYANYTKKITKRYQEYNYTLYISNKEKIYTTYLDLISKLENYENENLGSVKIIHGDPVFTNIILDNVNKLKFIDMRGKIDNKLTIYGDWLYDWAKIYQSLIGYDEILNDIDLDLSYKNNLINYFKDEFLKKYSEKDFENLKLITKSLLFTLIPLHNNKKCQKYFNLIFCDYLH